jgi:hypothetical protein
VRDEETGLVWEKTLETIELSWTAARVACADKDVGGRRGWRLPNSAWLVLFDTGKVLNGFKTITFHSWCVRGGMNADQY